VNICTVIAKNYLAHARVLARSVADAHPEGRVWVLVIDDLVDYIDPAREPFELLTPADIGCEPFVHMALRYSVLELSTAVKPWLLRHLLALTGEPVMYLDPDIKVYGSLAPLLDEASEHGVAVIPHNLAPIPADNRTPSQVDIMIAGIYNLGFVALSPRPEVDHLLDWWADRLRRDCRVDPVWGYFVDQRWFDLAPGFLDDLAIVRAPAFNVAYWNLHERMLEGGPSAGYQVDGEPLGFFHFSGFDPTAPLVLSRHQSRIDVTAHSVLEGLLAGYAADVLAEGHAVSRSWPYEFGVLGDGTRLDARLRDLFDEYATAHDDRVASPFTREGVRAFDRWLAEPVPRSSEGVTRALALVYAERADLQASYGASGGLADARLYHWAREFGRFEEPLLARIMNGPTMTMMAPVMSTGVSRDAPLDPPASNATAAAGPSSRAAAQAVAPAARAAAESDGGPLHREPWGVNVVGYFRSEAGTGEAARQLVGALDHQQIPVLPVHGETIPVSRQNHPYETAGPEEAPFPVNIICMNADMLPAFARQVGPGFFSNRYSVGLWFWEVSRFPDRWHDAFSLLEEVWAPTEHIAAALQPLSPVPVHTIRLPVAPGAPGNVTRKQLGLDDDQFLFLFSFDYLSVPERKNPLATVDAFMRAFAPGDETQLVIKCINSEYAPDYHARLQAAVAEHPDIVLVDSYLSPEDNAGLPTLCDCYVSLHRAEGFGLVLAEAMFHGKPVIATGYSGNLDFMTPENSLLVDHTLVAIGEGVAPYPADGVWAEPDIGHAAELMRSMFDNRDAARELGLKAAAAIRLTHSRQVAGEILSRRLATIRGTGRVRPAPPVGRDLAPALATLSGHIGRGAAGAPHRGAARSIVRRSALRAMRPFTTYQNQVNEQIAVAMQELAEATAGTSQAWGVELSRLLAEVRRLDGLRRLPDVVRGQAERIEELERQVRSPGRS